MMEVMRRRLRLMRRDGDGANSPNEKKYATTDGDQHPDNKFQAPRESATTTKKKTEAAMPSPAVMPFKRLLERVKSRLTVRAGDQKQPDAAAPLRRTLQCRGDTATEARLASLKFCVWRGGNARDCGWTLQRRRLEGDVTPVWVVSLVTSLAAWEEDGIRPGDVLETINGESLACFEHVDEVMARLSAALEGTVLRFRVRSLADRCRVQRFFVVVNREPIGASIVSDGDDCVPVVIAASAPSSGGTRACAQRGDVLIEVNGESVVGWGMPAVMALFAKRRPGQMTITFQRWMHTDCGPRCRDGARMAASSTNTRPRLPRGSSVAGRWRVRMSGDEFHDFSDDEGDEGDDYDEDERFTLGQDAKEAVVIVWRFGPLGLTLVKDEDAQMPSVNRLTGKGMVEGIERLHPGYHLASINGDPTHKKRFRDVMHELQKSPKPLWLVFLAPHHRVSMLSACSRFVSEKRETNTRWSSSSSLLSLDEMWGVRSTTRLTSTAATTYESQDG